MDKWEIADELISILIGLEGAYDKVQTILIQLDEDLKQEE